MIIFTTHARVRLKERHITAELVRKIVKTPDTIRTLAEDTYAYYGKHNGKTIKIILSKRRNKTIIITLYYENYV